MESCLADRRESCESGRTARRGADGDDTNGRAFRDGRQNGGVTRMGREVGAPP